MLPTFVYCIQFSPFLVFFFLSPLFDMVLFGVPLIFLISFSIFSIISFRRKKGGGLAAGEAGGRFFQKKNSFYHTYDIISGEKWVLGFYSTFATLFYFFQSLPVSSF